MPTNSAAWLVAAKAKPLEVRPAPYTPPRANEIVVKNAAVAINPVDWKVQEQLVPYPMNYPKILGTDVAGEVVEVGSSVTRFRLGDRVLGCGVGVFGRDSDSAFQEYTVLLDNMSSPIPSSMSFEAAAVIPLGLSTAACGLYQRDYLELQYPSVDSTKPTGQVLLVWGGSSSVGSNGIQLGVSSGYEVIATASSKNFDYVKKLGASQVFDYKSETIVEELVEALKGKTVAGVLDSITVNGAVEACAEVLRRLQQAGSKLIVTVGRTADELPGGVRTKWIFGNSLKDNEVGKLIYEDYLPRALAEGKHVPSPEPLVVGKGLHSIQDGVDVQRKGVSAKKVVISL